MHVLVRQDEDTVAHVKNYRNTILYQKQLWVLFDWHSELVDTTLHAVLLLVVLRYGMDIIDVAQSA